MPGVCFRHNSSRHASDYGFDRHFTYFLYNPFCRYYWKSLPKQKTQILNVKSQNKSSKKNPMLKCLEHWILAFSNLGYLSYVSIF
jgi:hypothetical protein